MEKDQLQPYVKDTSLTKSNLLINSKYKSSLNANKVMYATLLRVQNQQYEVDLETQEIVVSLPSAELARMIGTKASGALYKSLDRIAKQLTNTTMGVNNEEERFFEYIALITRAKYENGIFSISFNPRLKGMILDLKSNFTVLPKKLMMSFKSVYSYRMYELLRQRAYYPKTYHGSKNGIFQVDFDIYELRLLLGVVNSNLDAVERILQDSNPPDYKRACEASPEKVYEEWSDFKKNVIDRAVKEINENILSEIEVKYKPLKKIHAEVYGVSFHIYLKEYYQKVEEDSVPSTVDKEGHLKKNLTPVELFMIQSETADLFRKYGLPPQDILSICDVAGYDIESIRRISGILEETNGSIDNVTAWIIAGLKKGYSEPVSKKKQAMNNPFNQFEQREIDFDELERRLLSQ